jgi:hypothetical protein
MRRFVFIVAGYVGVCLIVAAVIILRGDGPHPRVIALYPFNGDRYFPGGAAQIVFSQSMDGGSVERGLDVSPGSQGQGAWFGNTLNLQPVGDWQPNVTYRVRLTGTITDDQGRPLPTPFTFWFRVHHVQHVRYCAVGGIRNVCEVMRHQQRPLTHSPTPVLSYGLSPYGNFLAYIRRDASTLPHLFIIQVDGTGGRQLTYGRTYADQSVFWSPSDNNSVNYRRSRVTWQGTPHVLANAHLWNIAVDGSNNAQLR